MIRLTYRIALIAVVGLLVPSDPADAAGCDAGDAVARVVSLQGSVALGRDPVARDSLICPGDILRVGPLSRTALMLLDTETIIRIDQNTQVRLVSPPRPNHSLLELLRGVLYLFSREPRALNVYTPYVNAGVEGTEFLVRVDEDRTQVTVFEGRVSASNDRGRLGIRDGQTVVSVAGQAPVLRTLVEPEDAVQWALYYPPVISALAAGQNGLQTMADASAALQRLQQQPEVRSDVLEAALLLALGRVEEAQSAIDRAMAENPENAEARALQAIIAVTRNRKEEALRLAAEAVGFDPDSAAAYLALSYARQAVFDIEGALASAEDAVSHDPDNALTRARLAELWLMEGYRDRALEEARRATELNPRLSRTQTVLGFAALAGLDFDQARQAFSLAITLNQVDPLPRLGLGLTRIRVGELKNGREELAIAVGLDPQNSLLRSYLGKAYFEEKRDALSGTQFDIAKALDPLDPTPWFYDAIRKQTENRPVEALQDIQRSIELNDNRAVYRSQLLLDEDLAARGTSLARIYDDLGFEQLALVEGAKSLAVDPSNHSAHRFLADTYARLPRHEIARVSELLQAQLLQPENTTPLQPLVAETNLAILEGAGPPTISFNEFTPLFSRNGIHLLANGLVGSNATRGEDFVVSGIQDQFSYSMGQFHYETEGFRPNNDLRHDIYDAFFQYRLSPQIGLQLEWIGRDTEYGDIDLRFEPDVFFPNDRRKLDSQTTRFGLHYAPDPASDWLLSLVYQDSTDKSFTGFFQDENNFARTEARSDIEGDTIELQYRHRAMGWNATLGVGNVNLNGEGKSVTSGSFQGNPFFSNKPIDVGSEHYNAYVYLGLNQIPEMTWTLGMSYENFQDPNIKRRQINPKLGVVWMPAPDTVLRLAALRTIKRPLVANRTVEPTQVASFNQFFDDVNGSESWRYGIGVDYRVQSGLFTGLELSWRDISVPLLNGATDEQDEQLHSVYLYWNPEQHLALGAEYRFDALERSFATAREPRELKTHTLPLSLSYFSPDRFYSTLTVTYVDQEVKFADASRGDDQFWIANLVLGYRFPKRAGSASLAVNNLFDETFLFQDRNFQTTEPEKPRFIPERTLLFNVSLVF